MAETIIDKIVSHVLKKINSLSANLSSSGTKATLAVLRRGAGKAPGEMPELWGSFLEEMPEALIGKGNKPSQAEWAVYTTLVMYALHQQGNDIPMNDSDSETPNSLGTAVGKLISTDEDLERILRRFNVMATSADMMELSHHLRTIINLLKSQKITLNYGRLAKDLYWYQSDSQRANVRLQWGRDFYKQIYKTEKGKENEQ